MKASETRRNFFGNFPSNSNPVAPTTFCSHPAEAVLCPKPRSTARSSCLHCRHDLTLLQSAEPPPALHALFTTRMIALEVRRNGKRVCLAGAEDLSVLCANVAAVGMLGRKTMPARPGESSCFIHYSVTGLTSRPDPKKDVHLKWKSVVPLRVGDVIEVKIVETKKVDRAKSRVKAKPRTA